MHGLDAVKHGEGVCDVDDVVAWEWCCDGGDGVVAGVDDGVGKKGDVEDGVEVTDKKLDNENDVNLSVSDESVKVRAVS